MAASDFHFYEDTFTRLNGVLGAYVSGTATSVIGAISGVAYTLLMIYIMLWGWSMLRGMGLRANIGWANENTPSYSNCRNCS